MTVPVPFPLPALPREGALLVGYSGGLDSTALLHRLAHDHRLRRLGLRAIHVHHGLHADADDWAAHCARTCAAWGVDLATERVEVRADAGDGPEAAARTARHAAFADALRQNEVLVLAHHRDDQAETFLLRALRASGVDGLAGMRPWRAFGRGWLWRPLLDTPRQALHDYARALELDWIEDPSNASDAADRNHLRLNVLPRLRARWPHADAAFTRAAALQGDAARLLDDEDARALAQARTVDGHYLHASRLAALPAARRARVLRLWMERAGLPPLPARGVARVDAWLDGERPADAATFAWQVGEIRYWRDLLWAGPAPPPGPADVRLRWNGACALAWPGGGVLALEPADLRANPDAAPASGEAPLRVPAAGFVVHARRGGERITLPGRRHSHALKHVLQDLGVPPWIRARLPILADADGSLLAAGDVAVSDRFDTWLRATGRRLSWTGIAAN
ncbi:tRNA lysidine(34) synthetase TilS [Luteimonas kalidii]|uniref:tRNA(Ile)-lysidine synthase n=1 Tax=Luteimonas kalidii TaxID=3042025 RepID=A0ABT6JYB8_9GAMM|nr:tRNA lysidine(34) synthetase TilS [Luteimonas kalidii]MDH5835700.1 tRNA lysidine(34) synthetase TilS [Luteimonas kalidii]